MSPDLIVVIGMLGMMFFVMITSIIGLIWAIFFYNKWKNLPKDRPDLFVKIQRE